MRLGLVSIFQFYLSDFVFAVSELFQGSFCGAHVPFLRFFFIGLVAFCILFFPGLVVVFGIFFNLFFVYLLVILMFFFVCLIVLPLCIPKFFSVCLPVLPTILSFLQHLVTDFTLLCLFSWLSCLILLIS